MKVTMFECLRSKNPQQIVACYNTAKKVILKKEKANDKGRTLKA